MGLIFNNSMATGGLAHGSSHDPGDIDAEEAAEEQMEGGIHVDIGRGERTCIDMDCCQMNEAVRSNSGNPGGVMGQVHRGRKKKGTWASLMRETFLAMTEYCRVRT